jgi:hypothetical protein
MWVELSSEFASELPKKLGMRSTANPTEPKIKAENNSFRSFVISKKSQREKDRTPRCSVTQVGASPTNLVHEPN